MCGQTDWIVWGGCLDGVGSLFGEYGTAFWRV